MLEDDLFEDEGLEYELFEARFDAPPACPVEGRFAPDAPPAPVEGRLAPDAPPALGRLDVPLDGLVDADALLLLFARFDAPAPSP